MNKEVNVSHRNKMALKTTKKIGGHNFKITSTLKVLNSICQYSFPVLLKIVPRHPHGNSKAKSTTGAIIGLVLDSMTWKTTTHDMSWTAREKNLSMSTNLDTVRPCYTGNNSYTTRTGCRLVRVAKETTTTPCIQDTITWQLCVTSNRISLWVPALSILYIWPKFWF